MTTGDASAERSGIPLSHLDRAGRVDAGTIGSTWGGRGREGEGRAPGSMRQAGRGAGRSSGKKARKSSARASRKGPPVRRPPVRYYNQLPPQKDLHDFLVVNLLPISTSSIFRLRRHYPTRCQRDFPIVNGTRWYESQYKCSRLREEYLFARGRHKDAER